MYREIGYKKKRYYYYDSYDTWKEAQKIGKWQKLKNKKIQYIIIQYEKGYLFPYKMYRLYLTKKMRLF